MDQIVHILAGIAGPIIEITKALPVFGAVSEKTLGPGSIFLDFDPMAVLQVLLPHSFVPLAGQILENALPVRQVTVPGAFVDTAIWDGDLATEAVLHVVDPRPLILRPIRPHLRPMPMPLLLPIPLSIIYRAFLHNSRLFERELLIVDYFLRLERAQFRF